MTPGTVLESDLLPKRESNYLACLVRSEKKGEDLWGLAYVDASCAEFFVCELTENELFLELGRLAPSEILVTKRFAKLSPEDAVASEFLDTPMSLPKSYRLTGRPENLFQYARLRKKNQRVFCVSTLEGFGCQNKPHAVKAAGVILEYLERTQAKAIPRFNGISLYYPGHQLAFDNNTRKNLELTETVRDRSFAGSLLDP